MKYDYELVSESDKRKFVAQLKRLGHEGFRVIRVFEEGTDQCAVLEKVIYEPNDRKK